MSDATQTAPDGGPVRLAPLADGEADAAQQAALEFLIAGPAQKTANIYKTLARAPELAMKMVAFGRALRNDSLMSARHRETIILRIGWNCRGEYEFAQHRRVALESGMTIEDVKRICDGPDAEGWDPFERWLCIAADDLHNTNKLSDAAWEAIRAEYDDEQVVQAMLLIGYYTLVSYVLNALGTPIEPGQVSFPD
jgi:alkylhydroperoxidase family enzyme